MTHTELHASFRADDARIERQSRIDHIVTMTLIVASLVTIFVPFFL